MGTNYYLIKKKNLTPNDIDIAKKIHIGKSSYGWNFLLCVHKDLDILDWEDYPKFLENNSDYIIIDEYDEEISIDELAEIVTKRNILFCHNTYVNHFGLIDYDCNNRVGVQSNMDKTYDLTVDTDFI